MDFFNKSLGLYLRGLIIEGAYTRDFTVYLIIMHFSLTKFSMHFICWVESRLNILKEIASKAVKQFFWLCLVWVESNTILIWNIVPKSMNTCLCISAPYYISFQNCLCTSAYYRSKVRNFELKSKISFWAILNVYTVFYKKHL